MTCRLQRRAAGHLRRRARRGGLVHGQRRTGPHAGPHHAAARRRRAARAARRRRLRRADGRSGGWTDVGTFAEPGAESVRAGPDTTVPRVRSPDGEARRGPTPSSTRWRRGRPGCCGRAASVRAAVHLALTNSPAFVAAWLAATSSAPGSCRPTRWARRPSWPGTSSAPGRRSGSARRRGPTSYRPRRRHDAGRRGRRGRQRSGAVRHGRRSRPGRRRRRATGPP